MKTLRYRIIGGHHQKLQVNIISISQDIIDTLVGTLLYDSILGTLLVSVN